eukprot:tig00022075_g23598.t1
MSTGEVLEKEIEKAAKKQRTGSAKVESIVDEVVAVLTRARDAVTQESCDAVLSELRSSLPPLVSAALQEAKDTQAAASKLSKVIDKSLHPDCGKASKPQTFDVQLLNTIIAQHFFRMGRFQLGKAYAEEVGLSLTDEKQSPFVEMHQILSAIRDHNLQPAIQWAKRHREQLQRRGSDLEFKLHRLQFVHHVVKGSKQEALAYARMHFKDFASSQMTKVQRLMASLLFMHRMDSSPYADLISSHHNQWEEAAVAFIRDCCALLGLSHDSPLLLSVTAGCIALPTLLKLASVMQGKAAEWAPTDQLPVEIELGKDFHFHSIFACPVSRENSTAENPPMMLPCGHVISSQCMELFF